MKEQPPQPQTNDELLLQAEQSLVWARHNYGTRHNDLAGTSALISLAASALVIARLLDNQTEMMREVDLP